MRQKPAGESAVTLRAWPLRAGLEGDPAAEGVAGDVRALESLVVEELLERVAQHVLDRAAVGDQRGRLAVAGQVDEDDLAVLGERSSTGYQAWRRWVTPWTRTSGSPRAVAFAREHAASSAADRRSGEPGRHRPYPDATYL